MLFAEPDLSGGGCRVPGAESSANPCHNFEMQRTFVGVEETLRILLFAYLVWIPLPFGSVTQSAQLPLVLLPLFIFVFAATLRFVQRSGPAATAPYLAWSAAGLILIVVTAVQLIPLPPSVTRLLSPAAHELWSGARDVHRLLEPGDAFRDNFPLSVAPVRTRIHLLRLLAYLAAFQSAALLIRHQQHRLRLALALCVSGGVEVVFGLQQLYRGDMKVWGWENTRIFNRVTGTYVNPNHYAHYLAVIFPIALYLLLSAIGRQKSRGNTHLKGFLERGLLPAVVGIATATGCLAGILIAQSRGALLALIAGLAGVFATFAVRHLRSSRSGRSKRMAVPVFVVAIGIAVTAIVLVQFFGVRQTIARFAPLPQERETLVGRTVGIQTATAVWRLFPVFGSGLGTFEDVVLMRQSPDFPRVFTHAHNDYLELAATAGIGGALAVLALMVGYVLLWKDALASADRLSRERRRFLQAALVILTIVAVHALFDFNFFIPANAATVAVIAGAAATVAAPRDENGLPPQRSHS
jgi:O-antigen ligase